MSERYDALVIGGGVSGLTAAAYLGRAGLRTLVVEAAETLGRPVRAQTLCALDPIVVKDLRLLRHGLTFAARDMATIGLSREREAVVIGRDVHAAGRSIAKHAQADATAFVRYRREMARLARTLRLAWWNGAPLADAAERLKPDQRALVDRLAATSALDWLGAWFESDALKAVLANEAAWHGLSPADAGSALTLLWSASQEMCGVQGALALSSGGVSGLIQALVKAATAAGVAVQTDVAATSLLLDGGRVAGLRLASGEEIEAPLVLSSLSRRTTLLSLAPPGAVGLGQAQRLSREAGRVGSAVLVFSLNGAPQIGGAAAAPTHRFLLAERGDGYATACTQARLGLLPEEPVMALVAQPTGSVAAQGRSLLSVRVWPVPAGDPALRDALVRKVVARLVPLVPQLASGAEIWDLQMPQLGDPCSIENLLSGSDMRNQTPIPGLFLVGEAGEPVPEISGRAARHAARLALAAHRQGAA